MLTLIMPHRHQENVRRVSITHIMKLSGEHKGSKPSSSSEKWQRKQGKETDLAIAKALPAQEEGRFHGLNLQDWKRLHSSLSVCLDLEQKGKRKGWGCISHQTSKNGDRPYYSRRGEMCILLIVWTQWLSLTSSYNANLISIVLNTQLSILKSRNSSHYSRKPGIFTTIHLFLSFFIFVLECFAIPGKNSRLR